MRVLVLWLGRRERTTVLCVVSVVVTVLVTVFTLGAHDDDWLSQRRCARTKEESASVRPAIDDTSRMAKRRIGIRRIESQGGCLAPLNLSNCSRGCHFYAEAFDLPLAKHHLRASHIALRWVQLNKNMHAHARLKMSPALASRCITHILFNALTLARWAQPCHGTYQWRYV